MKQDNLYIDVTLPSSWQELSDSQLYYVYHLFSGSFDSAQIKTFCLFLWGKLKIVCRYGPDYIVKCRGQELRVSAGIVLNALHTLDFLDEVPASPVRISRLKGGAAVEADLQGVPFKHYLYLENLYQGYLSTQRQSLLCEMAMLLYGLDDVPALNQAEKVNVFYWWTAVKLLFQRRFNHFFAPVSEDGNLMGDARSTAQRVEDAMNAQIRALTKGDITKEGQVMAMDTWRALVELDAIAKESQELNAKYGKS